jgi:NitT/TauT family transport system substrate-binding protein
MREMLERQDLLAGFLRAHEAACEMIRHDPRAAAKAVSATTGMVDPGFVLETYRISPKYCASLPEGYVASTMKFAETLRLLGYISRAVREDEIFDRSLITTVHPGPHHYHDGITE